LLPSAASSGEGAVPDNTPLKDVYAVLFCVKTIGNALSNSPSPANAAKAANADPPKGRVMFGGAGLSKELPVSMFKPPQKAQHQKAQASGLAEQWRWLSVSMFGKRTAIHIRTCSVYAARDCVPSLSTMLSCGFSMPLCSNLSHKPPSPQL